MISRIIEYSIRNRFIVILVTAFVAVWGVYCVLKTPVDAIPDLSENQVIVFTDWMGRSPQEIDDQITYPLSVNLQGLAGVKAVRAQSEFNFSMIDIIFEDNIDFYFARQRVLERLSLANTFLPTGVVPYLAPDATALGQIFWYTLEGNGQSIDELRALQDWYVRYQLYVPGVAEVASVGGFVREYQVDVDPNKLRAYNLPLGAVYSAIARSNISVGGKVFLEANAEYLIRAVGWLRGITDIENVVVAEHEGVPVRVANVAVVQMGPQYRRSMLENKNSEAVGGVVLMRYGENPLAVTQAIKQRIEQLQPGLPKGVRIIPFYDRNPLIHGAIHTLSRTLTEEMIVASIAILLILMHIRSAIVVCATLPLAVLIAFILMYYLRIPSNIMSLSGIAISIGILVDAAVVMVENATHQLTQEFGAERVRGNTVEAVVRACRLVGKPIFFAVLIMLLSFLPVFALSGQEGKMFHPLAFTKSFAMVGVAILAITFVPAMIPIFIKGHLRREEDNWIVRSFIEIYKPVLTWLMKVPAAGLWFMGFLFILGAGFVPSQTLFLGVLAVGLFFGSVFFRRGWSQGLAFALLAVAGLWSWHFTKLGREFMPPLDEGSILDMPVTAPRVSIAQAGDDVRVRDAILRGFPEVDQVVGKVGRADTPTDPSGLEMVETIVSLQPKDWWPKRKFNETDALTETRHLIGEFQQRGALANTLTSDDVATLAKNSTKDALGQFDRTMREFARRRQLEFQPELAHQLVRATVDNLLGLFRTKGVLRREPTMAEIDQLVEPLVIEHGLRLVEIPRREEMNMLIGDLVPQLVELGVVEKDPNLLQPAPSLWTKAKDALATAVGGESTTVAGELFNRLEGRLNDAWSEHVKRVNWEIEDQAFPSMVRFLLEALRNQATTSGALVREPSLEELTQLIDARAKDLAQRVFLWRKLKTDVQKEMDSELQMPGWGNIWTQPIINRIDMLATGVRTMIGVKVFGSHVADESTEVVENGKRRVEMVPGIQTVANEIANVLRGIPGAVDVFPDQVMGRSYLQIDIKREEAARYGVNVADIQEAVEVAMGGMTATTTVEGRERFPVRVRYARDFWQTEDALKRTLVTGRRGDADSESGGAMSGMGAGSSAAAPAPGNNVVQIPVNKVADIHVVEGPSEIKSENGTLRAYVQLNVRDRDIVSFVEEAKRAVEDQIKLPPGFHIEWAGEYENLAHAKQTLQLVFPIVILLIFVILYMTFNDVRDALLIILAVPGALVGGVIFQSLFGFKFSVAVWVGYIACFGMATQTGIVMLVYLHDAINARGGLAKIASPTELTDAIITGAVHRLRPKLMTEGVAIIGLMPMLWATGVGAEVMKPMAAPVLGGLLIADEVIDLLIPVIFNWYQTRRWYRLHAAPIISAA